MKERFSGKTFRGESLKIIAHAMAIVNEYREAGFGLTLRQLYYQFVARGLIANEQRQYKRLGKIVSDARRAGLIDWGAIEDRTRFVRSLGHWDDPADIIRDDADTFRIDHWRTQEYRPEVWIEKDALVGVIEEVCHDLDVPFFSCRGYVSDSEIYAAAKRMAASRTEGKTPIVFHFGDHDPSGIDMTRDIRERLTTFSWDEVDVRRIALNMPQVDEHQPPPNPAKTTDSRYAGYIREYGDESWELDALPPDVLAQLIRANVESLIDGVAWQVSHNDQGDGRQLLSAAADNWDDVAEMLRARE